MKRYTRHQIGKLWDCYDQSGNIGGFLELAHEMGFARADKERLLDAWMAFDVSFAALVPGADDTAPMEIAGDEITATQLIKLLRGAHPNSIMMKGTVRRYRPIKKASLEVSGIAERAKPIVIIR